MFGLLRRIPVKTPSSVNNMFRSFSVSSVNKQTYKCKLLVVGGGSGGCTIAAKFARRLGKDAVIVLEPADYHYYQPLFTLVGAGVKRVADCRKKEKDVLPSKVLWLKDRAETINQDCRSVTTECGDVVHFEYIVLAVGLKYDYEKVPGLKEALDCCFSCVSTIYAPEYCEKTWTNFQNFTGGDAYFTFPDTPIKCPGAPQKIAYLADSYFRKTQVRNHSNIIYNTNTPVIFGVPKYAEALLKVVKKKDITVNYKTLLKEVRHETKEAVFVQDNTEWAVKYDMLHVTPPMSPPSVVSSNCQIADQTGYLDVDKYTLQHKKYPFMYGIGDCTNTPNSKTAAAVAVQSYVLEMNLLSTMKEECPKQQYNGYGACPLVTSYNTCIIAEFIYNGVPRETLPFNQARERELAYYMKKHLFPFLYWNFMLKGYYNGPESIRRIINPLAK